MSGGLFHQSLVGHALQELLRVGEAPRHSHVPRGRTTRAQRGNSGGTTGSTGKVWENVGKISGDPRRNGDLRWFNQHDASSSNNACITIWDLENLSLVRKDHHGASGRFTLINDNNWSKYNWFFRILTWNCLKIGNCQNHAFSCVPDWIAGDLPCYTQFSDIRHSVFGGVSMFSSRGHSEDEGQWNLCQCWLPSGNFT